VGVNEKSFLPSLQTGTSIFPIMAVSTIRTAMHREIVVEKLHRKFQNISEYSV
jgi:hypothetical protein